jgi:hypothetical protein
MASHMENEIGMISNLQYWPKRMKEPKKINEKKEKKRNEKKQKIRPQMK